MPYNTPQARAGRIEACDGCSHAHAHTHAPPTFSLALALSLSPAFSFSLSFVFCKGAQHRPGLFQGQGWASGGGRGFKPPAPLLCCGVAWRALQVVPIVPSVVFNGEVVPPTCAILGNMTKPSATRPSLLRFPEVHTFFHEFGHVMHAVLSKTKYTRFSWTWPMMPWPGGVEQDFLEVPSMFLEKLVYRRDVVEKLSAHYETGAVLDAATIAKLNKAQYFQAGLQWSRFIAMAMFDIEVHSKAPPYSCGGKDGLTLEELWATLMTTLGHRDEVPGTFMPASWYHLVIGYDAGYYGYVQPCAPACQRSKPVHVVSWRCGVAALHRGSTWGRGWRAGRRGAAQHATPWLRRQSSFAPCAACACACSMACSHQTRYLYSEAFAHCILDEFSKPGADMSSLGRRYRDCILEPCASIDGFDMLRNFLGREPDVQSFLKALGISDVK